MEYQEFIASKQSLAEDAGFRVEEDSINSNLFPFQKKIVQWALMRGKSAIFAECGLGKTLCQLEWARHVHIHTGKPVLILAPLAVASQTKREGAKFGIDVQVCRSADDVVNGVNVANYEMLHHFDASVFSGIALDESSILKSFSGKTTRTIIETFALTPYKSAWTATPAPNDYEELGNHSEFLGILNRTEMLATFFIHDGGDTSKWRLKGHGVAKFWNWLASWAWSISKPSDVGDSDEGYDLPPLAIVHHEVDPDTEVCMDTLWKVDALTLSDQRKAKRESLNDRVNKIASIINNSDEQWIVWCELNDEGNELHKAIDGSVQISGADDNSKKERLLEDFSTGKARVLITKPSIAGFGMNWQHCHQMAFVGVSHSYEQTYQAIRRCWRFGQKETVNVHICYSTAERSIVRNLQRKEDGAQKMKIGMNSAMHENHKDDCVIVKTDYSTDVYSHEKFTLHLGDCVEVTRTLKDECIDFSVFSPPFASLYTYSASDRDMGNSRDYDEFEIHFKYLVKELYRVLKPGRNVSFHCMNLPLSKERDGNIGIRDFRGDLIRWFQAEGFIFHSEVCIWKDPVTAMQRTKAIGLLYKQLRKDSTISRQGIPDYLVTMRKPGDNPNPVTKTHESFPVDLWQQYASPVWMDIDMSRTLQYMGAKDNADERHICPLQLDVIERAIALWTNPGDVVLSPFSGIGSEIYSAIKMDRFGVGIELKPSYWKHSINNCLVAVTESGQKSLFSDGEE